MAVDGCGRTGVGELVDDVWVVLNEALDLDDPVVAEIVVLRGGGRAEEVGPRRQGWGDAAEEEAGEICVGANEWCELWRTGEDQ